jgi:hypothetical protein
MQKRSGAVVYSPSDLIRYFASPFTSWMDRYHLENPDGITPDEETEEQKLVAQTQFQNPLRLGPARVLEIELQLKAPKAGRKGFSCESSCSARIFIPRTVSWLVGNFSLDKFRQQRQRFLPAEVASLRWYGCGHPFLRDV